MKMTKKFLVFLLAYTMAFYPVLGSLANAGSNKSGAMPLQAVSRGQESGVEKQAAIDESTKVKLQETYGKLPLFFIQNNGHVDEKVKFYEKGSGHATFFTNEGIYLSLVKSQKPEGTVPDLRTERSGVVESGLSPAATKNEIATPSSVARNDKDGITSPLVRNDVQSEIVKLIPLNANKNLEIIAEDKLEGKVNYFIGNDPKKWKTNIPTHGAVVYKEIYKNIDMKFYGNNKQMEYDIIVKPGADPSNMKLSYEGIQGLRITEQGDMEIVMNHGTLIQKKPYIYQEIDGKRVEVDGRFVISPSHLAGEGRGEGSFTYGFQVASYNKNHPLIIDPVLAYSTYLGGSGQDYGYGIAVDASGNAYIIGRTTSTNFPTANPIQGSNAGTEAFITKINSSGTALVYSTYLGGTFGGTLGSAIAVDISGNAYITGQTASTDFPLVNPIQGALQGGVADDAFVTKLNASGTALVYSTYLGGSNFDGGYGISVDGSGNAYVTGYTWSTNFPTLNPIQGSFAGYYDTFVTKINTSGSAFVYSTYLGGSGNDFGYGIAVDNSGNAYVTGYTDSSNFPLVNPIQGSNAGYQDAFVTKINTLGSALVYSTYLGGSGADEGRGIAVDSSGNAYLTGVTWSTNFPIASPIYGTCGSCPTYSDAFITKINTSGTALVYSTYLGGSSNDSGYGIAVDTSGNAYIAGETDSINIPIINPIQESLVGYINVFVTKIRDSGTGLSYSTYLGGNGDNRGRGIAVDSFGNAYITGRTSSTNFPTVNPIQGNLAGYEDVFVAKISPNNISGCIQFNGSPLVSRSVTLKQKRETDQITTTNSNGCYYFDRVFSGKSFQVIIDGPVVP